MTDSVPGEDPPEADGVARVHVRDATAKRKPNASKRQQEARTSSPVSHPSAAPGATQVSKISTAAQIQMRLLMRQGQSPTQIAAMLGLPLQTVASYLGISVTPKTQQQISQ